MSAALLSTKAAIDIGAVERELNTLWAETAGAGDVDDEGAVIRARVLNLLIHTNNETELAIADDALLEVMVVHPCRAIVMLAESAEPDSDIEVLVSARCQISSNNKGRHLCCEQVTLKARGQYTAELPSAATPLLVPDLPTFLWWVGDVEFEDQSFRALARAADRVIIDSAQFDDAVRDLLTMARFLQRKAGTHTGVTDFNWTRLTDWRALIAGCFDPPEQRALLASIVRVRIQYGVSEPAAIPAHCWLLLGWLASRLDWTAAIDSAQKLYLLSGAQRIAVDFEAVVSSSNLAGKLLRVDIYSGADADQSLGVALTADGRYLETCGNGAGQRHVPRVTAYDVASPSRLLITELGFHGHDKGFEGAVSSAAALLELLASNLNEG